jgi:hypothetical protein
MLSCVADDEPSADHHVFELLQALYHSGKGSGKLNGNSPESGGDG